MEKQNKKYGNCAQSIDVWAIAEIIALHEFLSLGGLVSMDFRARNHTSQALLMHKKTRKEHRRTTRAVVPPAHSGLALASARLPGGAIARQFFTDEGSLLVTNCG
ncbi:hypothetical protein Pfl01_2611 [Pseudomonas fluorescens Pf0-1]|uniref:Uncharacterized protein n=1 Tax=Pseudomonas fluorescens (strain Pf0-1) TaxID=205922 RepID=Q3KD03_PSEPF|nr:hypothetical protein Pfl01_2611 [Pseudomonas fluorescens Pf0-1]